MENNQDNTTKAPEDLADISGMEFKEAIGKTLGKEFADDQTALKAVKETFSFVSGAAHAKKALEAVMTAKGFKTEAEAVEFINTTIKPQEQKPTEVKAPVVDDTKFVPREEFDKKNFYNDNPDYKDHADLLETFAKANPEKSRAEIIQMDVFKSQFDASKSAKQKSILHSGSKVGVQSDAMTKAKEELKSGNQQAADSMATKAVMEAFPKI